MKVIVGLGNPGPEYDATRHNVGWWVLDRFAHDWALGPFRRDGRALCAAGVVVGLPVKLVKPVTYVNRSGQALRFLQEAEAFDPGRDLLVVVDDAALDVDRVRFRPRGSPGGHNGLKSISAALGSDEYHVDALGLEVALRRKVGLEASAYLCEYFPLQVGHLSSDRSIAKREARRANHLV